MGIIFNGPGLLGLRSGMGCEDDPILERYYYNIMKSDI